MAVQAYILIQTEVGKAASVAAEIATIAGVTLAERACDQELSQLEFGEAREAVPAFAEHVQRVAARTTDAWIDRLKRDATEDELRGRLAAIMAVSTESESGVEEFRQVAVEQRVVRSEAFGQRQ